MKSATLNSYSRRIELETKLSQTLQPDAKDREVRNYAKMESQHLRLRRTKIKLTDFKTVKVIGKGAFGEVSIPLSSSSSLGTLIKFIRSAWFKRWTLARSMQ